MITDAKAITDALKLILEPDQVTELRAIDAVTRIDRRPHIESGYFNDPQKLAQAAGTIQSAAGIYFIPNPVNPALLARAVNRIRPPGKKPTTSDHDMVARRWLLVDCDPVRPADISSTNEEHAAARRKAMEICKELHDVLGWPWPIYASSGNGAHLLYRINMPADDGGVIQKCLEGLAYMFNDSAVKVDETVFNPARIWKLYGSKSGKGDSTDDRPHRVAEIIRVPEKLEPIPTEMLRDFAAKGDQAKAMESSEKTTATGSKGAINENPEALKAFLESHGANVAEIRPGKRGGHVLILDGCPMNSDHGKAGDTAVILRSNGGIIGFECKHNGCLNYKWSDVRDKIAPKQATTTKKALPSEQSSSPQKRQASVDPWKPFPIDSLPPPIRTFVAAVAKSTGTDPAFSALAAIVVMAGCIGNRVAVLVKGGWTEPAVLWGALIGRSSTTKSPVIKAMTRALLDLYKEARRAFEETTRNHLQALEHHNVRMAAWKLEQKKGPPTDPPEAPAEPVEKRVIVSDITTEKLGELLQHNPLGLLLVRDELAAWVGSFDRYAAGGKGSDGPAWLSFYDAAPTTIDRKSKKGPPIFCERAAVSVLGSIQPGTLRRSFGAAEREAGLLGRVLMAYPPDRASLWTDEALSDDVAASWRDLLCNLLSIDPGIDDHGDPRPRYMPIGPDAKPIWIAWHNQHVQETADLGDEDLAAAYGKLKGACVRIALVLSCASVASGNGGSVNVNAEAMRRAITITEWFKSEARRVYGCMAETDEQRDVRLLIELVRRKGGSLTSREALRSSRLFTTADEAALALEAIVSSGLGRWDNIAPGPNGGQPSKRFVLIEPVDTVDVDNTPVPDSASQSIVNVNAVNTDEKMGSVSGDEGDTEWTG